MKISFRSLGVRLTMLLVVGTTILLAVEGAGYAYMVRAEFERRFDAALAAQANSLVTLTKFDGKQYELDFADEFMPEYSRDAAPEYFVLELSSGTVLERSHSLGTRDLNGAFGPLDHHVFRDIVLPDGRRGRQVSITFSPQIPDKSLRPSFPEGAPARALLIVARERQALDDAIRAFDLTFLLGSLMTLLLAAVLVHLALRQVLRPLRGIGREVEAIGPGDLSRRLSYTHIPSEILPLVEKLNQFLELMEGDFERERRFAGAAAHELRTPVSELRSLSEVALTFSITDDPEVQAFLSDIQSASVRMEKLVTTLLVLTRADHPSFVATPQSVQFATVIRRLCDTLNRQATTRKLRFRVEISDDRCGHTDPVLFEMLCVNLLDNAISYAVAGSEVTIALIASDRHTYTLRFENETDGTLDEGDLPHLTQQFWRKDPSRTDVSHLGLGLSLVSAYVAVLGLTVTFSLSAEGTFSASIAGLRATNPSLAARASPPS